MENKLNVIITGSATGLQAATDEAKASLAGLNSTSSQTSGAITQVGESSKKTKTAFEQFTKAVVFGNIIYSLTSQIAIRLKDGLRGAYEEANNLQAVQAQLTNGLKSTHDASGQTIDSLKKLADAQEHSTDFSKLQVMQAESLALTYTTINKAVFPQTIQAAEDLAQRFGIALPNAMKIVGRAMNDPAKGMATLQRYIGTLSPAQTALIKQFEKAGEVTKAQGVLLDALSAKMGGSAQAATTTFTGKMKQLGNILLTTAAGYMQKLIDQLDKATQWFMKNKQAILDVFDKIWNYLKPSLEALWQTFTTKLIPTLEKFWKNIIEPLIPVLGIILVGAIKLVINVLDLLLKIITPVLNFIASHKQAVLDLAAAFVIFKGTLMIWDTIDRLRVAMTTMQLVTIPGLMAKIGAMRALLASPAVMGPIAIAGALADIALVAAAINSVRGAIASLNQAQQSIAKNSDATAAIKQQEQLYSQGKISKSQEDKAIQALLSGVDSNSKLAVGGIVGGPIGQPVMTVLHGGEKVIPYGSTQNTSTVTIGTVVLASAAAVNQFFSKLDKDNILISKGLTPARGMS